MIKKEIIQTRIVSRAKYKCPKSIEALIYWANELYPKEIPDLQGDIWFALCEKTSRKSKEELDSLAVRELFYIPGSNDIYINFLISLMRSTFEYLQRPPTTTLDEAFNLSDVVEDFTLRYIKHRETIVNFVRLANILNGIRKGTSQTRELELFYEPTFIFIDENKKLDTYSNSFLLEVVKGTDSDRIRVCEICKNVFWANRMDKETCSFSCANRLRVQNSRRLTDEQKAERKSQKEKNKQHKKNQKYLAKQGRLIKKLREENK